MMAEKDKLPFVQVNQSSPIAKQENEYVILIKGNSISRCGCNDQTREELGWDRVCGMAASGEETDYSHLLAKKKSGLPAEKTS